VKPLEPVHRDRLQRFLRQVDLIFNTEMVRRRDFRVEITVSGNAAGMTALHAKRTRDEYLEALARTAFG